MSHTPSDAVDLPRHRRIGARAVAALAVALGVGAGVSSGVMPVTSLTLGFAVILILVGVGWALRRPGRTAARPDDDGGGAAAADASGLAVQIVPVWQRGVEAARKESERSMSGLLESFANVSTRLDAALGTDDGAAVLEFGSADELMHRHRPEIERLLESTQLALAIKETLSRGVTDLSTALAELGLLAKEVQGIGRATHLLAMNASAEASRAGVAEGGFAVIAVEVRRLASQSRDVATHISRRIGDMQDRIKAVRREVDRHDTEDDEIRRRVDEAARATVLAVLSSVAGLGQSSRTLRETSQAVQVEIEKISMSLQSQDRLSQMLTSATDDMARYVRWLQGEADPATATPTLWLERLEASYTMEDMRSSHHGTVKVDAVPAVEFF